jgi:hypothetical protein
LGTAIWLGGADQKKRDAVKFSPASWLAEDPGKRWTESFFLVYSFFWITAVAVIIATGVYEVIEEIFGLRCC